MMLLFSLYPEDFEGDNVHKEECLLSAVFETWADLRLYNSVINLLKDVRNS